MFFLEFKDHETGHLALTSGQEARGFSHRSAALSSTLSSGKIGEHPVFNKHRLGPPEIPGLSPSGNSYTPKNRKSKYLALEPQRGKRYAYIFSTFISISLLTSNHQKTIQNAHLTPLLHNHHPPLHHSRRLLHILMGRTLHGRILVDRISNRGA